MWLLWIGCTATVPVEQEKVETLDPHKHPNILLVTIDTLRADRVGAYGDEHAQTPNIDELAKNGWLFTESHAVTPLTLPSHASILTGRLPREHGIRDNAGFTLAEEQQTIAEAFSDAGYATAAFVSAYVLSHTWGLNQGFDLYHDPFHPRDLLGVASFGEAQLPAGEVLNAAKQWWKSVPNTQPKFAWIHLYDPHTPWEPVETWTGDPYRGEVAKVDHLLKSMFTLADDSWIVLTSDHGEGLWDHGEREHGVLLSRSVTRVPLIIRPPLSSMEIPVASHIADSWQQPQPPSVVDRPEHVDQRLDLAPIQGNIHAKYIVNQPVSGIDIAPTLASIAGVSFQATGENVLQDREDPIVYAETYFPYFHYGWHPLSMTQNDQQRWMLGSHGDAYHPITQESQSVLEVLQSALLDMRGEAQPTVEDRNLSTTQELALQALGYQTQFVFPDLEDAADPRDKIGILRDVHAAEQLPSNEAIPALEAILDREPMAIDIHLSLAYILSSEGRFEEALARCLQVLQQNPEHGIALNNAVILSHKLGKRDVAKEFAEAMRRANPKDVRPFRYLAAIYAEEESPKEVIAVTAQGLELEPNDPNLNYLKGLSHVLTDMYSEAIPNLLRAKETGSRATDIYLWLGIASENLGDVDRALMYYQQAQHDLPLDPRPNARAGLMLVKANRCPEAKSYLLNVAGRLNRPDSTLQQAMKDCGW